MAFFKISFIVAAQAGRCCSLRLPILSLPRRRRARYMERQDLRRKNLQDDFYA